MNSRYPLFAPLVSTIALSSVPVFEMLGPASTRYALVRSGEAGLASPTASETASVAEF